ncbi:MAG: NAD(P)/FAD-dependent oxidoreductase [Candidatus Hydrogenedentes bacterium]|nr:NAD(P)/FAD-dependent oxidoreductase [Candidatus Hydrogenedentota bacterium]
MSKKTAIIIGAGPAGLTAAYELLEKTDIHPIILEESDQVGGLAKTVNHHGNRMDVGPHRFFSKSDRVVEWWLRLLPLQATTPGGHTITYHGRHHELQVANPGPDPQSEDRVMLMIKRKTRIYFLRKLFDYPIRLSWDTLTKLGVIRVFRIGVSYLQSLLLPYRKEENLEQFFINRFGKELYLTFFKSYTEKVWGIPCNQISAEWGAQRVKGLSIGKALLHAVRKALSGARFTASKQVETSLIEQFMYPKYGAGQMWEETARIVRERGGELRHGCRVTGLKTDGMRIVAAEAVNVATGESCQLEGDYFFSTMPIRELVAGLRGDVPKEVRRVAGGLQYRDLITVGLLVHRLNLRDERNGQRGGLVPDNWIYIQESDVKLGRLQIFNNWSSQMVADPNTVWLGLEYFCNEGDDLWETTDDELTHLAAEELCRIDVINPQDVLDSTVLRTKKTYPVYDGAYDHFDVVRKYLDQFENLFLIGRNGMHRYNNQDHSMLTAMRAVENILQGVTSKDNIWSVNAEDAYHEEK